MCICKYEDPNGNDKRMCPTCKKEVRVSGVPRVAGYNPRDHKMAGEIVIVSQEEAEVYYKLGQRKGLVSHGMKFRR